MSQRQTNSTTIIQGPQKKKKQQREERIYMIHLQQQKPKPRVRWTEDTIDNQGMNKKKSNLCCIYHRPGDESSDTCTSDDQGNALERDRHTKHKHKLKCSKNKKKQQAQKK